MALALLLCGCHPAPPPGPTELEVADGDHKTALTVLVPRVVDLSLHDTPYAGQVKAGVMPVPGTSGDVLLRLRVNPEGPDLKASARHQVADVLGHMLVVMNHRQIHKIRCFVSVDNTPVEEDDLVPGSVETKDLKVGDVVPPERIEPQLQPSDDHWDRLKK
jgi:hypothetical protein